MRWILLIVALAAFALAFTTKSSGLMGLCLVVGFVGLFAALFAFAAERIASTSRPDSTLLTDKDINVLRASVRKAASKSSTAPPPAAS